MSGQELDRLIVPRIRDGCILARGLEIESLEEDGEKAVVEVSPCTSERGKIVTEIDISEGYENTPFLDSKILCLLLDSYESHFAELKCSTKLGLARLMWKAHRIYIYEKGKLKIRYAHSREDAIKFANSILRLVLPSLICDKCSLPIADCILAECVECTFDESPRILSVQDFFNGPLLRRSYECLLEAFEKTEELRKRLFDQREIPSYLKKSVKREFIKSIEYAMDFSLGLKEHNFLVAGVEMISLAKQSLLLIDQEDIILKISDSKSTGEFWDLIRDLDRFLWQINEGLVLSVNEVYRDNFEDIESKIVKATNILEKIKTSEFSNKKEHFKISEKLLKTNKKFLQKISA